jgi:signal transduction histidine kinase
VRTGRWLTALAFVAAGATAALLGAVLAADEGSRTLVIAALSTLGLAVALAALASGRRRPADDALDERAETASRIAHELRGPLMSIKGLASTAVRLFDEMSEDERRDFFGLIDEEASRLGRITEHSAQALAVDAGRVVYDLHEDDLGALVEEAAWAAPHRGHPMTVDVEAGVRCRVDRKHLAAVVASLVDNAAKYSPPDAPVDVIVRGDEEVAVLEVADRGPGIPADRQEDVFERFARWRPAGYEETPGAGLGLFLARAHVLAHDGTIEVVDRDDGGSILRITLPMEGSA